MEEVEIRTKVRNFGILVWFAVQRLLWWMVLQLLALVPFTIAAMAAWEVLDAYPDSPVLVVLWAALAMYFAMRGVLEMLDS